MEVTQESVEELRTLFLDKLKQEYNNSTSKISSILYIFDILATSSPPIYILLAYENVDSTEL